MKMVPKSSQPLLRLLYWYTSKLLFLIIVVIEFDIKYNTEMCIFQEPVPWIALLEIYFLIKNNTS